MLTVSERLSIRKSREKEIEMLIVVSHREDDILSIHR